MAADTHPAFMPPPFLFHVSRGLDAAGRNMPYFSYSLKKKSPFRDLPPHQKLNFNPSSL